MTPLSAPLSTPRPDSAGPAVPRPGADADPAAKPVDGPMITSDFETFLRMLTTQLQNQDPMNPMDPTDFAVQLATFSSVEQQVRTNQLLEGLISQSTLGELAGLVGRSASAPGELHFDGEALTLSLPPVENADAARLVVRNALNQVVDTIEVPPGGGVHVWRGLGPDGTTLPDGAYSFEVAGMSEGSIVATRSVQGFAEVIEARRETGQTVLVLAGGREVSVDEVTALR